MAERTAERVSTRDRIIKALRRDLIGPSWKEGTTDPDLNETLEIPTTSNPTRKYLGGYLEPSRNRDQIRKDEIPETTPKPPDTDSPSDESEDEKHDEAESELMLSPSSMGLTFATAAPTIGVSVEWGEYLPDDEERWSRNHMDWSDDVSLESGEKEIDPAPGEGIRLLCKVRKAAAKYTVTLRLVNDRESPEDSSGKAVQHGYAMATLYQPKISVSSDSGFVDVRTKTDHEEDPKMAILYRHSEILAYGHNVGVDWEDDGSRVWSEHIPGYEVPKMIPDKSLVDHIPSMEELSDLSTLDTALDGLEGLLNANRIWIDDCRSSLIADMKSGKIDRSSEPMKSAVEESLSNAESSLSRMQEGIETLRTNEHAREAFTLSNRSIQISQEGPTGPAGRKKGQFRWYPFQIAFQLLNLNGIVSTEKSDPHWKDRDETIDLAWFPTAGGKTEAYFGLIATTGFYRRLRYPDEETTPSVHAIMRYTLRLLTMDQAERLVRLVTAMNQVASEHEAPSVRDGHPFRVGMWVGESASPNKLEQHRNRKDARSIILDQRKGAGLKTNTRAIMFESCPWCGSDSIVDPHNWEIGRIRERKALIGRCKGDGCPYDSEEGIPFTPVDEDIYNNPPSILLGTVDKFVQAAYNRTYESASRGTPANVRTLLGYSGSNRPPDLIIQDELHLLSGPLGSLAGLLETALDVAWHESCDGHRPKYVAATATIRGAERDAKLMFGRELNIFPPPVNRASDNFFAREAPTEQTPGRVHLSLLGPPDKARTVADQPVASLLQSANELRQSLDDELVDPYWTLVSYYNSLRELGGAQSSLASKIKTEWIPEFSSDESLVREIDKIEELTSRVPQDRLIMTKTALENDLSHESPVDVVVTSNMFQVGIDISRLGVMTINGQPKSNSEYIQSSGRVGRKHPGLVVSMLRSTYPRDQSHYETHRAFHQEIYRHVDMTSTTPFSLRALDRALDTTLMALIRLVSEDLSERDSLNQLVQGNRRIVQEPIKDAFQMFRDCIEGRLGDAGSGSANDQRFIKEVIRELDRSHARLRRWVARQVSDGRKCCWTPKYGTSDQNEVCWAKGSDDEKQGRPVISSLRDVADEVRVARSFSRTTPGFYRYGTLPEGHLMSHASPGSIWEKDGRSYMTLGISNWENFVTHHEPPMDTAMKHGGVLIRERQIDANSKLLGSRERDPVRKLRLLPTNKTHGHVSYLLYPRTHRCEDGHLSQPLVKEDEDAHCAREGCGKPAVQMRFVSICKEGHIHDFNYGWWVQRGGPGDCKCSKKPIDLDLRKGHAYSLGQWVLRCTACSRTKDMRRVPTISEEDHDASNCGSFGEPWLIDDWSEKEPCLEKLVHRQVGSTSVTYNHGSSVLLIPLTISWYLANSDVVRVYLDEPDYAGMKEVFDFQSSRGSTGPLLEHLAGTDYHDEESGEDPEDYDTVRFFRDLAEFKEHQSDGPLSPENIRARERNGLQLGTGSGKDHRFSSIKLSMDSKPWGTKDWPIRNLSRVDRLTELRFITGVSRVVDSNTELPIDEPEQSRETFGIGNYNFGEGIYIDINPKWLSSKAKSRLSTLDADSSMPHSMGIGRMPSHVLQQTPCLEEDERNRNAFTILHSLSHLLIRKACSKSGYSLGSVKERLYFEAVGGKVKHAAILLYTSGPSSDGTLGGLAGQAGLSRMKKIVESALASRESCSNDPVCKEHTPLEREPNGAACHTCLILPETSCECRNHMLDRNWGD